MELKNTLKNRSIELSGILGLIIITALNQVAQTPLIYLFSVIFLLATVIALKKFKNRFDVRLFFVRSEGWNWWNGAFSGILAFMMSLYIQTVETGFPRALAEIGAITVFLMLMSTLFYGAILQDIQTGEIEVETS